MFYVVSSVHVSGVPMGNIVPSKLCLVNIGFSPQRNIFKAVNVESDKSKKLISQIALNYSI